MFKTILWNGKQAKFRRNKFGMPNKPGGGWLNFTNLEIFDASLKLSWLRRVQQQSIVWAEFLHNFNIHKLVLYGDLYAYKTSERLNTGFGQMLQTVLLSYSNKALKQKPSYTTPPFGLIAIWRFLSGRNGQVKVTL